MNFFLLPNAVQSVIAADLRGYGPSMAAYKMYEVLNDLAAQILTARTDFDLGVANLYSSKIVALTDCPDVDAVHKFVREKIRRLPFPHQFHLQFESVDLKENFREYIRTKLHSESPKPDVIQTVTTTFEEIVNANPGSIEIDLGFHLLRTVHNIRMEVYWDMCSNARLTVLETVNTNPRVANLVSDLYNQYLELFRRTKVQCYLAPSLRLFIQSHSRNLEELATYLGMAVALSENVEDTEPHRITLRKFKEFYSVDGHGGLSAEDAKYGYVLHQLIRSALWKNQSLNVMFELGKSKLGNRPLDPFDYYDFVYQKLTTSKLGLRRFSRMSAFHLELLLCAPIEKQLDIRASLIALNLLPRAKAVDENGVPVYRLEHFDLSNQADTWGSRLLAFVIGFDTNRKDQDILLN